MSLWPQYIDKTKNKPPRPLLVRALGFVKNKNMALDLGAGALNDSRYLLENGFKKIVAIDTKESPELVKELDENVFEFKNIAIEDYKFPQNAFDLVNAQFVLPFIKEGKIAQAVDSIKKSLNTDGVFVGQFFGPNDSWVKNNDTTAYSKQEVLEFFSGLETIYFKEEEKDEITVLGFKKHWHIFYFIVRLDNKTSM